MSRKNCNRPLSKEDLKRIFNEGLSIRETAIRLNVKYSKVYYYSKLYGLKNLNRQKKSTGLFMITDNPTYFRRYRLIKRIAAHLKFDSSVIIRKNFSLKEMGRTFIPDLYLPDYKTVINFIDKRPIAVQHKRKVILINWQAIHLPKIGYRVINITYHIPLIKAEHIIDIADEILIFLKSDPKFYKLEITNEFFDTF